jgi:hypothetical protein
MEKMEPKKWYQVFFVWDKSANNVKGYIDGSLKFDRQNISWPASLPNMAIGAGFNTSRFWKGRIDEVAIWNRALSEGEIRDIYDYVQ